MKNMLLSKFYAAIIVNFNLRKISLFLGLATWGAFSHADPIHVVSATGGGQFIGPGTAVLPWNPTLSDPNLNKRDSVPLRDSIAQVPNLSYYGACYPDKKNCSVASKIFYRTTMGGLEGKNISHVEGDLKFYQLNKNIAIGVKMAVVMPSSYPQTTPIPIPFDNLETGVRPKRYPFNFETGNTAYISLYIIEPFIGDLEIPETSIATLYASTAGDYDGEPLSNISLTGKITVNQSCNFTAGQILSNYDLGSMQATAFVKDQTPPGGKEQKIDLKIQCVNMPDGVKFKMRLDGTADAAAPQYVKTENSDVGLKFVEDSSNLIITPGSIFPANGALPLDYSDPTNSTGITSIRVSPVSSTGKEPQKGPYNATATITAIVE